MAQKEDIEGFKQPDSPQTIGAVLILVAGHFVVLYQAISWVKLVILSKSVAFLID